MVRRPMLWLLCLAPLLVAGACGRQVLPESYVGEKSKPPAKKVVRVEADRVVPVGESRTWTKSAGGATVEGALIKLEGGRVYLLQKNGNIIGIPLNMLSQADQQYARDTAARHPTSK